MKKGIAILLCLVFLCGITACGNVEEGERPEKESMLSMEKAAYEAEKKETEKSAVFSEPQTASQEESNHESQPPQTTSDAAPGEKEKPQKKKDGGAKEAPWEKETFDEDYVKLGEKLLQELEHKIASKVTVFNEYGVAVTMGYQPLEKVGFLEDRPPVVVEEITDLNKIAALKETLKTDQWVIDRCRTRSLPNTFLYFDGDLHVNLEGQLSEAWSWISINSSSGSMWYLVPNEVYNKLYQEFHEAAR